ncbi:hypothetical protein MMC14_007111 [Varicellaria rhodocarpa]|nr:hypothetical protein [Varicellaria rhodocarpa]
MSHLSNLHNEAAKDEPAVQRPRSTSQEELVSPSAEAYQDCNQSPTGAQSGAIPLVVQGPQKKATFKEPSGDDFLYHRPTVAPSRRNTHQMQRVSVFDWDPSGRQRSVGHDRMRFEDYQQAKESLGKDSHPGYDDNQQDRRFSEYRGRDSYPLGRMPPRGSMYTKYYELEEGHDNGNTPPRTLSPEIPLRLPWTMWMNSSLKNYFVVFVGEFVGTTMFLFFAFAGTQVANIASGDKDSNSTSGGATGFNPTILLYIALVFGFSLMVNVWVFFRISGGLFNPAVTLAMLLVRGLSVTRAFLLLGAQVAGSIFASFLVKVLFPTPLNVRTTLTAGTSIAQGIFIEAILTAELVFTIFMLAKEKHKATFIAPVGIGLALFIAELVGVFYTGGSLNPARSLGPCVVTGIWDHEHWIYWLGPAIGAVIAVAFYKFIKMLEYELANPGQDRDS